MTDKNLVEIVTVVDRSGSMGKMAEEAISGFNSFLKEQKGLDGRANFTLVLFNHEFRIVHDGAPIESVEALNEGTYVPDGLTALLDAVGRTIDMVGDRLADTPEEKRPHKVIFCVLTDGRENASREYNYSRVRDMVDHQERKYGWHFQYLAQGLDAFRQAEDLGMGHVARSYTPDAQGTVAMYAAASSYTTSLRQEDDDEDSDDGEQWTY